MSTVIPVDTDAANVQYIAFHTVLPAGHLTQEHMGRTVVVWADDRQSVRAEGTLTKIGHEVNTLNESVTWIALNNRDGWRWYKQIPSADRVGVR